MVEGDTLNIKSLSLKNATGGIAMEKTNNLKLNVWEKTDPILVGDFNENFAAIDDAIGKAGNCRITSGTYIGNGKSGSANPNTLSFEFTPKLVFVFTTGDPGCRMIWTPGMTNVCTNVRSPYEYSAETSFSNNTLSWYSNQSSLGPSVQLNLMNSKYFWIAIG